MICSSFHTLLIYILNISESLAGKVIWITGASSGIGRALAVKLASVRCRLVISARRENELQKLKEECVGKNACSLRITYN